jgi:hypothetical protein
MNQLFSPIEVIDPITGEKRTLSSEEQEILLESGVILAPVQKKSEDSNE